MAQTHTWDVLIQAQTVIAELNPPPKSVYDIGPYTPGQTNVNIASLSIKNVGTIAGNLSWRCYAHANQPTEKLLTEGTTINDYAPGASVQQPQIVDIPDESGTIPFGVKVKGETEANWPAWGSLGTYIFNRQRLDTNAKIILGVIGAAGIIGVLWYTKKKKMW